MSANIRVTRRSNKGTHPGMPDVDEEVLSRPIPKPRRTKAQITADNAAAAARKLEKAEETKANEEKKAKLIKSIATLENEMDDDEQQAEKEAARPPAKKTVKVQRPVSKGNNEAVKRADNLVRKKGKLASNLLNADNDKGTGGTKTSPNLERNITSSDIEFLEGDDLGEVRTSTKKIKNKPESTRASIDNARRVLINVNTDLSAKRKADDGDENDVITKKARGKLNPANSVSLESTAIKRKDLGPSESKDARTKRAKLSLDETDSYFGNKEDDKNRRGFPPPTGFRPSWQHPNTAALSTNDMDSDTEDISAKSGELAQVDQFDYAADDTEDNTQEATSMSTMKPARNSRPLQTSVKIEFQKPAVIASKDSQIAKSRTTFSNSDLPAGTLRHWQAVYLPAWYQHLGTLKNPWSLGDLLSDAQRIWNMVFPNNAQTLAVSGEPIFYLTKQRSYEWRGGFATTAVTAVQEFWNSDPQYASAEAHADFVEWAIPVENEEPSPFTWASVDETDNDNIVYKGFFQSYTVLATFSTHLALISQLPSEMVVDDAPEGALSMATTSVERAFKMWSTGEHVKPMKANGVTVEGFTAAWAERTALYLSDIETLPPKTWKKIVAAATKITEEKKGAVLVRPAVQAAKLPLRRRIVDADSDESD